MAIHAAWRIASSRSPSHDGIPSTFNHPFNPLVPDYHLFYCTSVRLRSLFAPILAALLVRAAFICHRPPNPASGAPFRL
jgi:hypothetical protein